MSKVNIPQAQEMAKLAAEKQQEFEKSAVESDFFRRLIQKIESTAIEGRTGLSVSYDHDIEMKALQVMMKYLRAAGYVCRTSGIRNLNVSWDADESTEGR